jgi:N-acetylglutamate synthase-like GNAT family acetyltransferase
MIANALIRVARIDEAQQIKDLHDHAIQELCSGDYTSDQIQEWINRANVKKYQHRIKKHRCFVAELDGKIIGQVRWNPKTNELCSIFVDPKYTRQGMATILMRKAYDDMIKYGVEESWLDASLTAVPFYLAEGWQYIEKKTDGPLECVRMIMRINIDK